uniref:10 kDa heat shock protein, mitochondrial n=1 Tax=Sinocyclocheilus grahami TaxID=75366 RepID=A0A672SUQ0_SINGR
MYFLQTCVFRDKPVEDQSAECLSVHIFSNDDQRLAMLVGKFQCWHDALYAGDLLLTQKQQAFRKFLPMFDRVLVERLAAETVTKGGIMIPEKAQAKVLQATVVAVGPGSTNKDGKVTPVCVKVGDKVMLPEYGGTKVFLDDKDYFLFRDGDILGKYVE